MKNEIVLFYEGTISDTECRFLDDILKFSNLHLESVHNYIQFLFPNRDESAVNLSAPLLTDAIVAEFKARPELRAAVKRSLDTMIKFYDMDAKNPWWCTKNNHNYLRCTRILNTLREFGMTDELNNFHSQLMDIYENNTEVIGSITLSYWGNAFEGQEDYSINVTAGIKVKASRCVAVRAGSLQEAINIAIAEVEDDICNNGVPVMNYEKIDITSIYAEEG